MKTIARHELTKYSGGLPGCLISGLFQGIGAASPPSLGTTGSTGSPGSTPTSGSGGLQIDPFHLGPFNGFSARVGSFLGGDVGVIGGLGGCGGSGNLEGFVGVSWKISF